MFKFFKKKKAESPVDFIDVAGYGSARIIPKPRAPSNLKMSSDGYVSVPAPSENSYLSPYTSDSSACSYSTSPSAQVPAPTADDMNFLGAMANASSALDSPAPVSSSPYPSPSAYPTSSQSSYPSYPSYPYPSSQTMDDNKIYKILRKLDFLTEKLEVMEMKISRIERKTGVVESI